MRRQSDETFVERSNPRLKAPEEITRALSAYQKGRSAHFAACDEWRKASRPTAEERRAARLAFAGAVNADVGVLDRQTLDLNRAIGRRIQHFHGGHHGAFADVFHHDYPITADHWEPSPQTDTHFWWSETNGFFGDRLKLELAPDGEHFFGRIFYDEDDLLSFNARVIANFTLHANRFPQMPTKRMNSEPRIDVTGAISAWTGLQVFPWAMDDKWSKCSLALTQTAFQFNLGQFKELGSRTETHQLVDDDGKGYGTTKAMPGNIPMPALQLVNFASNLDIHVVLEVRFDVQLEGDSFIGFSPADNSAGSVLVRFSQWAPVPL